MPRQYAIYLDDYTKDEAGPFASFDDAMAQIAFAHPNAIDIDHEEMPKTRGREEFTSWEVYVAYDEQGDGAGDAEYEIVEEIT